MSQGILTYYLLSTFKQLTRGNAYLKLLVSVTALPIFVLTHIQVDEPFFLRCINEASSVVGCTNFVKTGTAEQTVYRARQSCFPNS